MKNVITFSTKLPNVYELEDKLKQCLLPPMTDLSAVLHGFIPHPYGDGERLVLPYEGGYSFAVQTDEKIIPKTLVAQKVAAKMKQLRDEQGIESFSKSDKKTLTEEVYLSLLPTALHKSKVTICHFNPKAELLLVDSSSDGVASNVVRLLIKALGSLKTTTIHISDLKIGLSKHLAGYLEEIPVEGIIAFNGFAVGTDLKLIGPDKEKVAFSKLDDVQSRKEELLTLLDQGYRINEIALSQSSTQFKLTENFIIKGVKQTTDTGDQYETAYEQFQQESAVKLVLIADIIQTLCSMFGYDKEVEDEAKAA